MLLDRYRRLCRAGRRHWNFATGLSLDMDQSGERWREQLDKLPVCIGARTGNKVMAKIVALIGLGSPRGWPQIVAAIDAPDQLGRKTTTVAARNSPNGRTLSREDVHNRCDDRPIHGVVGLPAARCGREHFGPYASWRAWCQDRDLDHIVGVLLVDHPVLALVRVFTDHSVRWIWSFLVGILGVLAGLFVLRNPMLAALAVPTVLVLILGFQGLIMGVLDIIGGFKGGGMGSILLGVLDVLIGFLLLRSPIAAALAAPIVFGLLLLVQGVALVVWSFRARSLTAVSGDRGFLTHSDPVNMVRPASGAGREAVFCLEFAAARVPILGVCLKVRATDCGRTDRN
jgi:uncharacterized membrane protein HdeD (DUF308 family)